MSMKIKKGDKVIVITGKDKGKTGEVVKAMPKENKVVVAGIKYWYCLYVIHCFLSCTAP